MLGLYSLGNLPKYSTFVLFHNTVVTLDKNVVFGLNNASKTDGGWSYPDMGELHENAPNVTDAVTPL